MGNATSWHVFASLAGTTSSAGDGPAVAEDEVAVVDDAGDGAVEERDWSYLNATRLVSFRRRRAEASR